MPRGELCAVCDGAEGGVSATAHYRRLWKALGVKVPRVVSRRRRYTRRARPAAITPVAPPPSAPREPQRVLPVDLHPGCPVRTEAADIDAALARGGLARPEGVPLDVWLDSQSEAA